MPRRTSKEYDRFVGLLDRLMSVPRAELQKHLDAHRERAAQNPNRRGPKRKTTARSATDPAEEPAS